MGRRTGLAGLFLRLSLCCLLFIWSRSAEELHGGEELQWFGYQAAIVPLGAPANFTASSKQIGIDITEFKSGRYKQFDDLLDGILCAYLAYYFLVWGKRSDLGDR